jgi:two-component system, OmpR family, response regulator
MYPKTLALVDDDQDYSEFLAEDLRRRGIEVTVFGDSNDLLADPHAYGYGFYLLDLMLPGVDGQELLKILRRRSNAGVLVVSGRLGPEVFRSVVTAGADMYLAKPVSFEQVVVAIEAVQRRAKPAAGPSATAPWRLECASGELVAPDGARVALSEADIAVLECFVTADGEVVERETLRLKLGKGKGNGGTGSVGGSGDGESDGINATIYRLRRRIERATPLLVPLQSRSRVGYVFKAPLQAV